MNYIDLDSVLEDISQYEVLHKHGIIPLLIEVKNAVKRMANGKAAGDNKKSRGL